MQSKNSDIVNRVIAESATKREAVEVVDWFSDSIEGQQFLSDMIDRDAYLMESDPHTGVSFNPMQSDLLYARVEKKISNNRFRRISLRVAAVILPLIFMIGFGWYLNARTSLFEEPAYTELYIPKGETARIFFQDGTEVFINADTRIRYPERFGLRKRDVWLDGEAYFNVASAKKRPFIVHTQNTEVNVLGTSFNVNSYRENDKIRVVLDDGKVAFRTQQHSYAMLPGQQLVYDKVTGAITLQNLMHPSNLSLWKNRVIYFYDTPLAEVMSVLERQFNVTFNLQSADALKYSYTLTTKHATLERVLNELQKIAPVKFSVMEDQIQVSM
jgi:ferric-dicitrate binding protein FerR (iron transport regulator)